MTKARTAGAKRRRQKQRLADAAAAASGRPPLEGIRREAPTGSRATGRPERPTAALRRAYIKRAELAGIDVPLGADGKPRLTPELVRRLQQQWMGCNAGRAIESLDPAERAKLWDAIRGIRRTYNRWLLAIGAPSPYPQAARLLYATEGDGDPGGYDGSLDGLLPTEPLSEAEEQKAAANAMMLAEMWMGMAGRWVKGCILNDEVVRDRDRLLECLRGMAR